MKRHTILLSFALILLGAVCAFAGDGNIFGKVKTALPAITAVFGFAGGMIALLPKIRKLQRSIEYAKRESLRVKKKYEKIVQDDIRKDIDSVFKAYDAVLERVADICAVLRMKKAERALRGLL
jgi:hypothetical protein